MTYLNEFCPVDPPNAAVYDFGMFSDAVKSGILTKTEFLRKFSRCFWWGLRNLRSTNAKILFLFTLYLTIVLSPWFFFFFNILYFCSSFGQNLDTSDNVQENFFAVLISILGLLLFLYLIGTLQVGTIIQHLFLLLNIKLFLLCAKFCWLKSTFCVCQREIKDLTGYIVIGSTNADIYAIGNHKIRGGKKEDKQQTTWNRFLSV